MDSSASFTATSKFFGQEDPSSSSMDQKCQQCMDHLTSILMTVKSKPKILFEAMGVSSPTLVNTTTNTNHHEQQIHNKNICWSMDDDGKGVKLQIPKMKSSLYNHKVKNEEMTGFGGVNKGRNINNIANQLPNVKNNQQEQHEQNQTNNQSSQTNSSSQINDTILQRVKTKLRQRFQTKELATSSSLSSSSDANNNITLEIQCRQCGNSGPEGSARAFLRGPSPLTIILCTNRLSLSDSEEIEEVLTHELIHVFDVHHRKWDFSNCQTLARSEIRAAREAECGNVSFGFWKESCVRDKAKEATRNMFRYKGIDCVNKVFNDAMRDNEPFDGKGERNTTGGGTTIATSYKEK